MTDYVKSTGGAGTLIIRDSGGQITFLISCTDGQTRNYDGVPWSGYVNENLSNRRVVFPRGAGTVTAHGPVTVTTGHVVNFGIGNSGTWGLGGPTNLAVFINRSSEPSRPSNLHSNNTTLLTLELDWTRNSLNGGTFIYDQIQVSSAKQTGTGDFRGTIEATKTTTNSVITIDGLMPGVLYYAHVRTKTSIGWSSWTNIATFKTRAGLEVKRNGVYKDAILYVKQNGVWKKAILYVKRDGVWHASDS